MTRDFRGSHLERRLREAFSIANPVFTAKPDRENKKNSDWREKTTLILPRKSGVTSNARMLRDGFVAPL
jgi:hypothetical protein